MSAPIGPGDWVECVDTRGCDHIVTLGRVYLVEDVATFGEIPCLILRGVVHPQGYRKVRTDCFRPIYRPNSETFRSLLTPAPEVALEDA